MPSIELKVENELGIHARPAQHIVKIAARYAADFFIVKDGQRINGKSILGVLMLAAEQGSLVKLEADGAGAQEMLAELTQLFKDRFHEE
jgi:phosphocarrier protein HPr